MKTVGDLDELCRDPNSVAGLSNAPFQDVIDIQSLADLNKLDVFAAEKKSVTGRTGRNAVAQQAFLGF